MKDIIEGANILNISGTLLISIIALYFIVNIITAILDFKGKVAPTFINMRAFFRKRKENKKALELKEQEKNNLIMEMGKTLKEINSNYSEDNITKRNNWMNHINEKEKIYDESVKLLKTTNNHLSSLEQKIDNLILDQNKTLLHSCVDKILSLAQQITKEEGNISEEKYKHAFELHEEYENLVKKTNDPNHRVDYAWEIITEAYKKNFK